MSLLFIPSILEGDYNSLFLKIAIVMLLWLLPVIASVFDLITGVKASKVATDKRKLHSRGLRKTVMKDLGYLSLLFVFFLIDFATSYLVTLNDVIPILGVFVVPVFTLLLSIILCGVELWSIKENVEVINQKDIIPNKTLDNAVKIAKVLGDDKINRIVEILELN